MTARSALTRQYVHACGADVIVEIHSSPRSNAVVGIGMAAAVMMLVVMLDATAGLQRYLQAEVVDRLFPLGTVEYRQAPTIPSVTTALKAEAADRATARRPPLTMQTVLRAGAEVGRLAHSHHSLTWDAEAIGPVPLRRGHRTLAVTEYAYLGGYFATRELPLSAGRAPALFEEARGRAVIVIGSAVAEDVFGSPSRAIGQRVTVRGIPYRICGVAKGRGSLFGMSLDRFIVVPMRSIPPALRPASFDSFVTRDVEAASGPSADVTAAFRTARGVAPGQPANFAIQTGTDVLAMCADLEHKLALIGSLVPLILALIGTLILANVMLVRVHERTHEFGIRRAMGATATHLVVLVLTEVAMLTGISACAGLGCAWIIDALIHMLTPLALRPTSASVCAALALCIASTLAAAVPPTIHASGLDPVTALGRE